MEFNLRLPDALRTELTAASRERGCSSPAAFVAELVHSELAARRLPFVSVGRCGARVQGDASACDEPVDEPECEEPEDDYVEPPLTEDVESLEGLTNGFY